MTEMTSVGTDMTAYIEPKIIVEMLDALAKQLKEESYSKDYIGGLRHAQHEIETRFCRS